MRIAVLIPFRPRGDKSLLQWTLEGYRRQALDPGHTLEVHVGIDGEPEEPPPAADAQVHYHVFPRMGAAGIRNALAAATANDTELLIFGNADARPADDMVQQHARTMPSLPPGSLVLGSAPWETAAAPTVMDALLNDSPAVFFYGQLRPHEWHDFRCCWTLNLSVRKADFVGCGGFHEAIRPVYYEDLAFGHRLMGKDHKAVWYEPAATVLHRHPTTFDQYLDREELLGIMAPVLARNCAGAFGMVFGTRDLEALARQFRVWVEMDAAMHRWIYQRMQEWAVLPATALGEGEQRLRTLMAVYQMHMPLKRLAFRLGFLKGLKLTEDSHWMERKAEGLWRKVTGT
jgi:hypothetical protein